MMRCRSTEPQDGHWAPGRLSRPKGRNASAAVPQIGHWSAPGAAGRPARTAPGL